MSAAQRVHGCPAKTIRIITKSIVTTARNNDRSDDEG
jgi:hypothetical protein